MTESGGRVDRNILRDLVRSGNISRTGSFFTKNMADVMKQAAANLGGIKVEELGDRLSDGTKKPLPDFTGVRVTWEGENQTPRAFWEEVDRLEAESEKTP